MVADERNTSLRRVTAGEGGSADVSIHPAGSGVSRWRCPGSMTIAFTYSRTRTSQVASSLTLARQPSTLILHLAPLLNQPSPSSTFLISFAPYAFFPKAPSFAQRIPSRSPTGSQIPCLSTLSRPFLFMPPPLAYPRAGNFVSSLVQFPLIGGDRACSWILAY